MIYHQHTSVLLHQALFHQYTDMLNLEILNFRQLKGNFAKLAEADETISEEKCFHSKLLSSTVQGGYS